MKLSQVKNDLIKMEKNQKKNIKKWWETHTKKVFDKLGNKLDGTFRKVLSDLPAEELFDKNGNLLDDKNIIVVSSLPEEEYYDNNENKIDGIYQKDEPGIKR